MLIYYYIHIDRYVYAKYGRTRNFIYKKALKNSSIFYVENSDVFMSYPYFFTPKIVTNL